MIITTLEVEKAFRSQINQPWKSQIHSPSFISVYRFVVLSVSSRKLTLKDIQFRQIKSLLEKPHEQGHLYRVQKHAVKGKGMKHQQWLAREASWRRDLWIPVALAHWHAVTLSADVPALARADKQQFAAGFSDGWEPFFSILSSCSHWKFWWKFTGSWFRHHLKPQCFVLIFLIVLLAVAN